MRGFRRIGGIAATLSIIVGVTAAPHAAAAVTKPADDPFYRPPANYASQRDGAVLRTRTVRASALGLPLQAQATQVLFKSIDARHKAVAEVTTVLVPKAPWRGPGARPVVSYQVAEDGLGTQCAPSYALRVGLRAATSNAELETIDIAALLARGWAVVTTDYEGPHSQFLTGPQEGYAVLDGVRAALAAHPDGLSPHARVAMWGYSGGAFATAWATKLRPSHAPHLRIVGIALGDMPSDLTTAMKNVDGAYGFGLAFGGIVGIARGDPSRHLASIFNARGQAAMNESATACTVTLIARFAFRRLSDYTVSPHPFSTPALKVALAANSLFSISARAPIYDYHATTDDIVPVRAANLFVAKSCARGDHIQIVRTPLNNHITEQIVGALGAMKFLAGRFAGAAVVDNCPT